MTTNWRRFTLLMVPAVAASAAMASLTVTGAVASSLTLAGDNFKISASRLEGEGVTQFPTTKKFGGGTERRPVIITGIRRARIHDMCDSLLLKSPMGPLTMVIRAGGSAPVEADNLIADIGMLGLSGSMDEVVLGADAGQMTGGPPDALGTAGRYGQQIGRLSGRDVRMDAPAVVAGSMRMTGLTMELKRGRHECF